MTDSVMSDTREENGILSNQSEGGVVALSRPKLVDVAGQAWFTHPSFSQNFKHTFEVPQGLACEDYERLEFAGDRVIGWVVPELIIECYPMLTPGAATTLVSRLVCEEIMSRFTVDYGLLDRLRASPAVRQTVLLPVGARIRCDLFEAYIGAFYHDHGHAAVRTWLRRLYAPLLHAAYDKLKAEHAARAAPALTNTDQAGAAFAELSARFNDLSMRMQVAPSYQWTSEGPTHAPSFTCRIQFGEKEAVGAGGSKKASKQAAVTAMYEQIDGQ